MGYTRFLGLPLWGRRKADFRHRAFSETGLPVYGVLGNSENIERVSLTGDVRDS